MPSDGDGVGMRFAWGYGALKQNRASIPPASIDLVGSVIGSESPRGNFAPECGQRVEFPAWTAQPHALDTRLGADGDQRSAAVTKPDRKSTRLNSSHSQISYAVFCLTQ